VNCLVQPGDGATPLIKGINSAKKSIEIMIFRFNRKDIEKALALAVTRGVKVHALIAFTNRGGQQSLRDLEMRFLAAGITVSRTRDDLIRYHGKLMIIDGQELYLLAFNYTYLDMERSRSFGIVTKNKKHVEQASKLFEADSKRQPYTPGSPTFVVSPVNARRQLSAFIKATKRELLIYDPEISDPAIIRILEARVRAGVNVRVIGKQKGASSVLPAPKLPPLRLHTRSMVRDGTWAFVGSQSLRSTELDARREVGIIFRERKAVARLASTFEEDWKSKAVSAAEIRQEEQDSAAKVAKKVAKAVVEDLSPVKPLLDGEAQVNHSEVEATVKQAVKDAVRQVVLDLVEEAEASS
jgi:cardiolipin synthase